MNRDMKSPRPAREKAHSDISGCRSARAQRRRRPRREVRIAEESEALAPTESESRAPEDFPDPFAAPVGHCPKCIAPWSASESSCRACGVLSAHAPGYAIRPPPELARRWQKLRESWSEPGAHKAFLAHAQTTQQLERAARLYRIHLVRYRGDAAAEQGLAMVVRMALVPTQLERPRATSSGRLKLVSGTVFACIAVLCALILASVFRLQQGRAASSNAWPEAPVEVRASARAAH